MRSVPRETSANRRTIDLDRRSSMTPRSTEPIALSVPTFPQYIRIESDIFIAFESTFWLKSSPYSNYLRYILFNLSLKIILLIMLYVFSILDYSFCYILSRFACENVSEMCVHLANFSLKKSTKYWKPINFIKKFRQRFAHGVLLTPNLVLAETFGAHMTCDFRTNLVFLSPKNDFL